MYLVFFIIVHEHILINYTDVRGHHFWVYTVFIQFAFYYFTKQYFDRSMLPLCIV